MAPPRVIRSKDVATRGVGLNDRKLQPASVLTISLSEVETPVLPEISDRQADDKRIMREVFINLIPAVEQAQTVAGRAFGADPT
jgi:hypothetical protein